jgi:MFS-type transporter involved in bile tolerance (Atg22 family)
MGEHALPTGTTVSSSSKALDLGPAKAVASGIVTTVVAALGAVIVANADDVITANEWLNVALATIGGFAAGFGITFATPTKVTLH